jgi:hypothetical protein
MAESTTGNVAIMLDHPFGNLATVVIHEGSL